MKSLDPVDIENILALTPLQEGMLFHYLQDPQGGLYFEQLSLGISGIVEGQVFEKAWNRVIQTNEMLRAVFRWEKLEKPSQVILKEHRCKATFYDLSTKDSTQKRMALDEIKENDRRNGFDLRQVPFRVILCKLDERRFEIIISNHHILYDGWSNGILLKEFFEAYHALQQYGQSLQVPLKPSFKEFIKWSQSQDRNKQEHFWREYLSELETPTELPIIRRVEEAKRREVEGYSITLEEEIRNKVDAFVKNNRFTLASVLYTAWGILLQKYCNTEDVLFGSVVSGRSGGIKGIREMVGLFINTIPLRVHATPNEKIIAVVFGIDHLLREREEYENTPLVDIGKYSSMDNSGPLFDTIVAIENYPLDNRLIPEGSLLSINSYSVVETTHYDLSVGVMLFDEIKIKFSFKAELFDRKAIQNLASHFKGIIQNIIENPETNFYQLEIISSKEKIQIIHEFNNTAIEYLSDKTIHQLFSEQATRTPDIVGVVGFSRQVNQVSLSYRQLNEQSDRLAGLLLEKGVQPDAIVGIMVERSIEMIIGILGILKAGGAYLPIDPEYPQERIEYMLTDSNAKIWLVMEEFHKKIIVNCQSLIINCKQKVQPQTLSHHSSFIIHHSNLSYIIYTSGTTGRPKGVMVEHRSVTNVIHWFGRQYRLKPDTRIILMSDYTFDASVDQIFGALLHGASLYVVNKKLVTDIDALRNYIDRNRVNLINFVPTLLNELLSGRKKLESLCTVISGAEKLDDKTKDGILKIGYRLYNHYGPTEGTIDSLTLKCSDSSVSLGKPIANVNIHIFDKWGQMAPIGVPGELYISGAGLARGYLNQPELTAERFDRSHRSYRTYIFYKTGDLCSWLPNGNIAFMGRIDQQVKLRGFRFELGEIEAQLLKYPGINEAVVITKEDSRGDKYLCAYIVPRLFHAGSQENLKVSELIAYLAKILPVYMIPSYFMQVEKLPLTANGKLNRKALPDPGLKTGENYVAPRSGIEEQMVGLWSEILGRDALNISQMHTSIGIDDNFFQLGGHSLKAISLASRIHKIFNVKIPLAEIFNKPTVRWLSNYIENTIKEQYTGIAPIEKKKYYMLSSAQKRLYFLQQMDNTGTAYNISAAWLLEGIIDRCQLEDIFVRMVKRHESLRTSFAFISEEPVQRIHDEAEFEIEYKNIATDQHGQTQTFLNNFIHPFDLSKAPLLRVGLVKLKEDIHLFLVDMHHIISDGMSTQVLVQDFLALYSGKELPEMKLQFKDYVEWQNQERVSKKILEQGEYWKKEYDGEIPVLDLPTDYARPSVQYFEGDRINFEISQEISAALKAFVLETGTTLYIVLLASYAILLSKLSGREDIIIGSPVAGRRHTDLEMIIGMFVNTLALRNYPTGEKKFTDFLEEVKEKTVKAFENQEYQFEDLVENVAVPRDISRNPLFDAMFTLQNTGSLTIQLPGMKFIPYEYENKTAKFDLTLSVVEVDEKLQLAFHYSTKLFRAETVENFAAYFSNIINAVIENCQKKISDFEIITEKERSRIMFEFNDTEREYPKDRTIYELFEDRVEQAPDLIAVFGRGRTMAWTNTEDNISLSYFQLNQQSDRLSGWLIENGIQPDNIVAILIESSIEMLIGIIGILKSGGAYLPIDPEYPQERIDYMLKDSGTKILINETFFRGSRGAILQKSPPCSANIAYVIYTSGTTGNPKGVLIENRNLANYINWFSKKVRLTRADQTVLTSSFGFDLGYTTIYPSILSGSELHLVQKETYRSSDELVYYLCRHQITYIKVTPSLFSVLVQNSEFSEQNLRSLRLIVLGGEPIKLTDVEKAHILCKHTQIMNHYGPTETTIGCVAQFIDFNEFDLYKQKPTIGYPIDNMKIFILDKGLSFLPIGVPGELCISGAGVGRGYLNRPELTSEKFHRSYEFYRSYIFYKTGDLARWTGKGTVEFLGRSDKQIKIRGFRVELSEIESSLLKYGDIKNAVVVAGEMMDDKYLCAYIVADKEYGSVGISGLQKSLAKELPDYMIPSYFVQVEKIPVTPNGKLDLRALPKPGVKFGENYVGPRSDIERKLLEMWSEILGRDPLHVAQLQTSIGIDDNFFQLGGHSLKATIFASRVNKELNVKLPLVELFKTPTIRGLSEYLQGTTRDNYEPIMPVEEKEYYVLSFAQKRMYILQQLDLNSTAYNMPHIIPLPGEVDIERLDGALKKLIQRHSSLRTSFQMIGDQPVQRVHASTKFFSPTIFRKDELLSPRGGTLLSFIRPFDLSQAPLLRVCLVKNPDDSHILLVDMHHIISDGISRRVFKENLMALYEGNELPPLRLQYKDFAQWQNSEKEKESLKHQEEFWLKEFEGEIAILNMPTDYPRPLSQSFEGGIIKFGISVEDTRGLNAMALQYRTTMFMVLAAAFNILLSKLTSQEEISIGTPTAGRRHPDLEKIIGMFINTLVLRNYPTGECTFKEFLGEIRERVLMAFENQEYPFEELVDKLSLRRDMGRNPLFDVMFVLHNLDKTLMGLEKETEIEIDLPIRPELAGEYEDRVQTAKFDLTLTAIEKNHELFLSFQYYTKLFKKGTIEWFIIYFKKIVSIVLSNPGVRLSEIEIITEEEKRRILLDFNNTEKDYPKDKTIHQLFIEQALKTPDRVAVVGAESQSCPITLSYNELNEQSDRLAGLLMEKGVLPDTIAAIMMERSIEMIIGLFGILKAGGAYLPIDPGYPQERIQYMLRDSKAKILLTASDLNSLKGRPRRGLHHSSLAYIIYTSGSTGKPKGVMINHGSVVNILFALQVEYPFTPVDTYLLKTSYVFDVSVTELFGWTLGGGKLVILEKNGEKDPQVMCKWIDRHHVTHINFVPSMFNVFVSQLNSKNIERLSSLKYIFLAGEALLPEFVNKFRDLNASIRLENIYGPTEGTVYSSKYSLSGWKGIGNIPIGRPLPNIKLFILNNYDFLQPVGIAGELYISGLGLARGYLNHPGLTAERFNRSYRTHRNLILYKTGDLARWLSDGDIEFLGRIDHQAKIRGFRVELGEIENWLLNYAGIKEAVVIAQEEEKGDKYLCAYIVPNCEVVIADLRNYLSKHLPDYMTPSFFVQLEKIPLNPSGKLDRRALPKPGLKSGEIYTAPSDAIEMKLVEIWSEILGRDELHASQLKSSLGTGDNFFQVGGHSLKATILASRIEKTFGIKISLAEIFKNPRISALSGYIKNAEQAGYKQVSLAEKKEYYTLASAQKRLYFLQQVDKSGTAYNLSAVWLLEGIIDIALLEKSIRELIQRHESLRTSIELVEEEPVQRIYEQVEFEIEYNNIATDEHEQTQTFLNNFIHPFDLSQAPLLRVGLIKIEEEKHIFLVDMHHIISDGVSTQVLVEGFSALYAGRELPVIKLQYKDYAEWQSRERGTKKILEQGRYWEKEFEGEIPVLALPTDYARPGVQSFEGNNVKFELDGETFNTLKAMALEMGTTLYIVLLAIYTILLSKLSGQEDIIVGTPVAGRRHADLEKVIGMFVNTLALRNYPSGEKKFADFLGEVKERTLEAFENQEYQYEDLVEQIPMPRDASRNPLFDTMFALQNTGSQLMEISGLKLVPIEYEKETSIFDLSLTVVEIEEMLKFIFQYNTQLFKPDTIEKFKDFFGQIISIILNNREIKIDEIKISHQYTEIAPTVFSADLGDFESMFPGE